MYTDNNNSECHTYLTPIKLTQIVPLNVKPTIVKPLKDNISSWVRQRFLRYATKVWSLNKKMVNWILLKLSTSALWETLLELQATDWEQELEKCASDKVAIFQPPPKTTRIQ